MLFLSSWRLSVAGCTSYNCMVFIVIRLPIEKTAVRRVLESTAGVVHFSL